MAVSDEILSDVDSVINAIWETRTSSEVPNTEGVKLQGGAVEVNATFLYADLAGSSKMAKEFDRRVTAKIIKSFLAVSVRIIRAKGGTVISFDGDRVLGVFVGDSKNTNSVLAAFGISYAVTQLIRPKFEAKYESVRDADFKIAHAVGIDTGTVLIVRAGARGSNDLISIGRAPNLAAKMSDLREPPYDTFITSAVYNMLAKTGKEYLNGNSGIWEQRTWEFLGDKIQLYRSSYWRKP